MVQIKTSEQIEGIRNSSRLAAAVLEMLRPYVTAGTTTETLNKLAHSYILDHHAVPAPLNYGGFPKSICTSVNNVVCHGIPSESAVLKDGDIINLDITTILDGYFGDTSATFGVGNISSQAHQLIKVTRESLILAIDAIRPGRSLNSCVGAVIENYVKKFGFSPVRDLGGHGVGIKFHEDPFVFHFATKHGDVALKPGMIFTVEPMINASRDWRVTIDPRDGWTVRTYDGSLSAQFEHTVLVTSSGAEILTQIN